MEIKVGRNVKGAIDLLVPDKYINVSQEHSLISLNEGVLFISDLNSTNGTFVNGRRIASKELSIDDKVMLGGQKGKNAYPVNLLKVMEDFKKIEFQSRTDFVKEFQEVIRVYKKYQADISALKRKVKFKSNLPMLIVKVGIGGVVVAGLMLKLLPDGIIRFQGPIIIVLTTIIGGISIFKSKEDNILENQLDIEIKYEKEYKCPKCKKEFNLRNHWKKLESKKTCPYKCGAIFKK